MKRQNSAICDSPLIDLSPLLSDSASYEERSPKESSASSDHEDYDKSSTTDDSSQPSDHDEWEERCAARELAYLRKSPGNTTQSKENQECNNEDDETIQRSAKRSLSPPAERRNPIRARAKARKDIKTVQVIANNGVTVQLQGTDLTADTIKRMIAGAEDQLDDAFSDGDMSDVSVRTDNTDATSVQNDTQGSEEDKDYEPVASVQVKMGEVEDATPHINETSANAAEKNDGAGQECLCPNAKGKCWEKAEKGKYLCSACEKVCINEYDGKVRMMCACDCGPCQQEEDEDESSDEGYDGRAEAN